MEGRAPSRPKFRDDTAVVPSINDKTTAVAGNIAVSKLL
jgi:hypothetical protein